jgi:dCMP deaminase
MNKRENYISWDEYFIGVANLSGKRSKDPGTQVGACIVDDRNVIVGTGYNGLPHGCDDDDFPWNRDIPEGGDITDTKYPYVVHAELNAILNSSKSLRGCTLYVNLHPCNECAKAIIQAGITTVKYVDDKYNNEPMFKVSSRLFKAANVNVIKLNFLKNE